MENHAPTSVRLQACNSCSRDNRDKQITSIFNGLLPLKKKLN